MTTPASGRWEAPERKDAADSAAASTRSAKRAGRPAPAYHFSPASSAATARARSDLQRPQFGAANISGSDARVRQPAVSTSCRAQAAVRFGLLCHRRRLRFDLTASGWAQPPFW